MSLTFALAVTGAHPPLNLANSNACALLTLVGIAPTEYGEVMACEVAGVVARLLRIVNVPAARASVVNDEMVADHGRWHESARDDAYVARRARDLLALFCAAQRVGCGVTWG